MSPDQVQAKLAILARTLEQLRSMDVSSLEAFKADDRNLGDIDELARHYLAQFPTAV